MVDPGCKAAWSSDESPACDDGIDNDGDGKIDLADSGCLQHAWRNSEVRHKHCGLGFEWALVVAPLALWRRRRQALQRR